MVIGKTIIKMKNFRKKKDFKKPRSPSYMKHGQKTAQQTSWKSSVRNKNMKGNEWNKMNKTALYGDMHQITFHYSLKKIEHNHFLDSIYTALGIYK